MTTTNDRQVKSNLPLEGWKAEFCNTKTEHRDSLSSVGQLECCFSTMMLSFTLSERQYRERSTYIKKPHWELFQRDPRIHWEKNKFWRQQKCTKRGVHLYKALYKFKGKRMKGACVQIWKYFVQKKWNEAAAAHLESNCPRCSSRNRGRRGIRRRRRRRRRRRKEGRKEMLARSCRSHCTWPASPFFSSLPGS